ncbi:hypothetical protein SAMN05444714_2141 [Yoonia litorea]|uniref:Flagellar assembly protein FliH n=2 Tax=Yoonia litorea TaxID=1123755 RepID=A0A1I6MU77_9RHOB|nr:hypothetical protein SAMN05444714_2141 [Yoonia litorea]
MLLESFDEGPLPNEPVRTYEQGLADGHAAATREFESVQGRLTDETVQTLKDLEFTFAEAQADLQHALKPLFADVCSRILPELIDQALPLHIAEILSTAASELLPRNLSITLHPDQVDSVSHILHAMDAKVEVTADHAFGRYAAAVSTKNTERYFDLEAVSEQIADLLANCFHSSQGDIHHG